MSIKGKTFQSYLGNPLNLHNFIVEIADPAKNLSAIQIMCSAATFPSERLQDFTMYFQGERVKFPSIPTNTGTWTASFPEGELAKLAIAFKSNMDLNYNQQTGKMTHWAIRDKFDIIVKARGLRGDVAGSDVVFQTKLIGCYMSGKEDVSLSNENATANWVWQVQFSFDSIEDSAPTPLGAV